MKANLREKSHQVSVYRCKQSHSLVKTSYLLSSLQVRQMNVGDNVWQPLPLPDAEHSRRLHQLLHELQVLLLGVTNGQVSSVQVDLGIILLLFGIESNILNKLL